MAKGKKINQYITSLEEEEANTLVFYFGMVTAIGSVITVVGFFDGSYKDMIMLLIALLCIIIRVLEKKTTWFKNMLNMRIQQCRYG